jgi:hypothetical protein
VLVTTTTVDVRRPDGSGDPYESPSAAPAVARGVDAHISAPSGTERNVGGAGERVDAVALLPSCTDVQHADRLTDRCTGVEYRVSSVVERTGLGLDHVRATLVAVAGGDNG